MDMPTCLFRYVLKYTQIYDYGCPQEKDMEEANMLVCMQLLRVNFSMC